MKTINPIFKEEYKNYILNELSLLNLPGSKLIHTKISNNTTNDIAYINRMIDYLYGLENIKLPNFNEWYRYIKI